MPLIECTLIKGYDAEVRKRLAERVTDAACSSIGAASDFVTVTIKEVDPDNYMRGRTSRVPASAPRPAEEIVRGFLAAMEARDLDRAQSMLGDGFTMTFPGTGPMTSLAELIAWSKGRYRFVTKTYETTEAFHAKGVAVVYTQGTLSGEWPDGSAFSGIRFIDRFELTGGKITRQDVWNDMGEVRNA